MKLITIFIIMATVFSLSAQHNKDSVQYLALGDSYTIGESVEEKDRWPVQLAEQLRKSGVKISDPQIIATTGWRTDDLKKAILAANPARDYGLVSLLIGVNNQYQGKSAESYAPEFEELLTMAIEFAGGDKSKVFVVSIPDYGFTPFGKGKQELITKAIDEFNAVNKKITEQRRVKYFDITAISRKGIENPELVASDGLHPSGKMYKHWADAILKGL